MAGVQVFRLWSTGGRRSSLWNKAVGFISFHASVLWFLLSHVRKGDTVILKTDPPLLQLFNTAAIRLKGGTVVNWLQDIYPEIAIRLGKFPAPGWLAVLIQKWRDKALNAAAANVTISGRMSNYLAEREIKNLRVIPNWADGEALVPVAKNDNPLRAEWGLPDHFVVMYSGNFGRVHAFAEIIEAVQLLTSEPDIHFVFIGEGPGLAELARALAEWEGHTVSLKPFQPRESLRFSLGAGDLHLVSLKPGMEDLVMPSKLLGILAAGRPIAYVGEPGSDIAASIERAEAGVSFASGDGAGLSKQIRLLANNPRRQAQCQRNARALFEQEFTREQGIERWRQVLADVREGQDGQ